MKWEHCHTIDDEYTPTHCAVLHDKVAVLRTTWWYTSCDVLHISSLDLHSWTTTELPYHSMSLTTYKSQFVAVGGRDPYSWEPTNQLYSSATGLEWRPSLPPMRTKRYKTASVGTTSPEALVVAGGRGSDDGELDEVEVLVEDNWHSVNPLPKPCNHMTSTLHQDEVVFTDRYSNSIFTCEIDSLISSCTTSSKHKSPWRHVRAVDLLTTTVSYSSRLVNIDGGGTIKGYCSMSQSWIEVTSTGSKMNSSMIPYITYIATSTLPTGDIVVVSGFGVYKLKMSCELFLLFFSNCGYQGVRVQHRIVVY